MYQPGQQRSQGHHPRCHRPSWHPWHQFQCHPLQLCPSRHHQWHHPSTLVPPRQLGQMPNYYPAPAKLYPICYPPGTWPPYQQYYAGSHGHGEEDSETAKPDKFTGQDPSKLHPFIVSCIMALDSRPCKFVTNFQWVSYTTSYLSDIAMLGGNPPWSLTMNHQFGVFG